MRTNLLGRRVIEPEHGEIVGVDIDNGDLLTLLDNGRLAYQRIDDVVIEINPRNMLIDDCPGYDPSGINHP